MGLFGELFKGAAAFVGNSILESIEETIAQNEEQAKEFEYLKQSYARTSMDTIQEMMGECSETERAAMESVLEDRKKLCDFAKNN